jgi:phage terminase small subunit
MIKTEQKPPKYLKPATKKWWKSVVSQWELEDHHVRLLTLAAGAWDRAEQARELLAEHGLTFTDPKLNRPVARPEVAIERDNRLAYARLLRELDLDISVPAESSRPPELRSIRGGKK